MGMAFRGLAALNPSLSPVGNGMPSQLPDALAGMQAPQLGQQVANPNLTDFGITQRIQPTTWQQGGKGWQTVGKIGDALALMGGKTPIWSQTQKEDAQRDLENQFKQQQLQIAAWKARNGDKTALQQNYEYLKAQNPQLAEQYLRAQANPMTLMTDPATGNVGFYPKGGVPGMNIGGGDMPTVSNDDDFNALPSGTQFRDPQGNVRVKP